MASRCLHVLGTESYSSVHSMHSSSSFEPLCIHMQTEVYNCLQMSFNFHYGTAIQYWQEVRSGSALRRLDWGSRDADVILVPLQTGRVISGKAYHRIPKALYHSVLDTYRQLPLWRYQEEMMLFAAGSFAESHTTLTYNNRITYNPPASQSSLL